MKIIFERIKWKNLLSSGNAWTTINLNEYKSTLILGKNGSGKSTMIDALTFALFNRPYRKINKPQLPNSINKKDCRVELEFRIGKNQYTVIRGIKPNVFEIYKDGELVPPPKSANDYQAILEKQILRLNYTAFQQVVVLGSSLFVPFMQLPAAQRREVIEDLLDINIFSTMNDKTKWRLKAVTKDIQDTEHQIDLATNSMRLKMDFLRTLKEKARENEAESKLRIHELENEKEDIESKVFQLSNEIEKFGDIRAELQDWNVKKSQIGNKISEYRTKESALVRDVKFFRDHAECPTCSQDIEADVRKAKMRDGLAAIKKIRAEMSQVQVEFNRANDVLTQLIARQDEKFKKESELSAVESELHSTEQLIDSIKKKLSESTDTEELKEKAEEIRDLDTERKSLIEKKDQLTNDREVLRYAEKILKDTGVKTQIIRQYVPVMNRLINKYLADMDFLVEFTLDETFNETIKSRYRDVFSYASFSEGEKLRIDLAILFTWRQIGLMRNSTATNLLILDEVFDASLDDAGSEDFLSILQNSLKDMNVFVISHKSDQLSDKFDNTIRFVKEQNFSRVAA